MRKCTLLWLPIALATLAGCASSAEMHREQSAFAAARDASVETDDYTVRHAPDPGGGDWYHFNKTLADGEEFGRGWPMHFSVFVDTDGTTRLFKGR